MPNVINATSTGNGGLITQGDDSGILNIQTNETTAISIDASQNATFAGKVTSAGALTLASNGTTTAVTIDTSQNVGIGTTSPQAKLHVLDSVGGTNGTLWLGNATYYGTIQHDAAVSGANIYTVATASGGGHTFKRGSTEQMRITSGGYFKASADGTYLGASGSYHELRGAGANGYELIITNTNASPASEYIQDIRFTATTPNNSNAKFLACTDPTNEKAAILSNGGFLSRNNSYGTYSDIKLKENIVNASPKLADVMRLQVRNFNFKTNPEEKQIGFIAQEFEQVFPSMVDESQDRSQDGTVLEETTKSIKTSVLVPILVKAIQELKAINDTQAETLTQQTEAINALTARIVALETA